ncbi:MAG: site-2 protease family protein, partial [Ktedonobacteraceae bacterium]|nr:site-2 protease family protein [Ktedonobacteraceae bacterium]
MAGSFRLGRLAGIDIYINVSWLIAVVLLTVSTASGWFPTLYPGASALVYGLLGLIASLLLFLSVLLHELAHSLVARARGLEVKNIVLFIFGGVSNIEQEPKSAGVEFQMALVGPVVSLLLGGLAFLLWWPLAGRQSAVGAVLYYLAVANVILGVFNLIPGFPLDGGRVLRSIIWKITGKAQTATEIAVAVGAGIAYLFILVGIWIAFTGNFVDGIWIGFIGWFMLSAAQSVRAQATFDRVFGNVTVEQVMNRNVVTAPANISLQKLVDEYILPQGLRSILVMRGDQFAGLITLSDIRHVPREEWAQTPVGLAMVPVEK